MHALAEVMDHLLVILALLGGYAVFVLAKADRACRKCSGWGHKAKRRRRCSLLQPIH